MSKNVNEIVKKYELEPIHNYQNSYYKKAYVTEYADGRKELTSYRTKVAECKNGTMILNGYYSATTWKHIGDFMYQNGIHVDMNTKIGKRLAKYAKECNNSNDIIVIKNGTPEIIHSKKNKYRMDKNYHDDMYDYNYKLFCRRWGLEAN